MNAVISLCHFCELHGPSVLFCTQSFHEHNEPTKETLGKNVESKPFYGPPELLSFLKADLDSATNKGNELCEGCTSMSNSTKHLLSNDHEAQVTYVSSQFPLHADLFSLVRQACVRSLSCEICPGREGPIYFGDNQRGHVLSYTFFMKDSQARGFQRWYSVIVIMMDKVFLLNSWLFLVKYIEKTVTEIQEKAKVVYEREQSEISQRTLRLNSVSRMTPDNFRRQRGNAKARSLAELTGDNSTFSYLHLWFTWILRAGGCRISERLLEGLPSEDTVVDLEKQDETEGFINVHTKKVPDGFTTSLKDTSNSNLAESSGPSGTKVADDDTMEIVQEWWPKITSLRELYKVLGKELFLVLAYHTAIGDQIILRGPSQGLIESIITCLKYTIPRGCCRVIAYSSQYEDSWKCNFLGLPMSVPVPNHVLASNLHLCIEVEDGTIEKPNWHLKLHHCATLPDKLPQILCDIERVVDDLAFSEKSLEAYLTAMKEVWLNKVKVLFTFSRAGQHSVEDTQKLLNVLGAQEQDKQLLKFWMTGLSTQYKTHVLSTSVQQGSHKEHSMD